MDNLYQKLKEVLLVVLIVLGLTSIPLLRNWTGSFYANKTFTVSAEGKATATPDVADFSFSVVSEGNNPSKIESDANDKITSAINYLKSNGVDSKDIKTTNYYLSPKYNYDKDNGKSYIDGYSFTESVQVKARDLTKVATYLGGLSKLGINQIGSVSFSVDNDEQYIAIARHEAFEKAFAKAEDMATQNKVEIKRLISFSEYPSYNPAPYYGMGGGGRESVKTSIAPTIETGSQEIKIQVNVTYEIE